MILLNIYIKCKIMNYIYYLQEHRMYDIVKYLYQVQDNDTGVLLLPLTHYTFYIFMYAIHAKEGLMNLRKIHFEI